MFFSFRSTIVRYFGLVNFRPNSTTFTTFATCVHGFDFSAAVCVEVEVCTAVRVYRGLCVRRGWCVYVYSPLRACVLSRGFLRYAAASPLYSRRRVPGGAVPVEPSRYTRTLPTYQGRAAPSRLITAEQRGNGPIAGQVGDSALGERSKLGE